jgi:ATP-dependent DNA ligase
MTTQTELREALNDIKAESGTGSKARKQERFRSIYDTPVGHIVTGERYDDAGVGPSTARSAVDAIFPELNVDDYSTISEALASDEIQNGHLDCINDLDTLVSDLDEVAEKSGDEQERFLGYFLAEHKEPSLVTLALLDDESIGLGTSQMREAFFDGTRDERKHREAFVETTTEFINLARRDELPQSPIVGEPFDPMLAVPESRGTPDNPMAQRKVDGYRILLHISDGSATAFTRAKNDETESLPELQEIDWPDGDYILDGEVIAENGSYSDTASRIGRKAENVERDVDMEFALFDAIIMSGEHIGDEPFTLRHLALLQFTARMPDNVYTVPVTDDIEKAKDEAIANDEEGIIVKDVKSPYEFGKRSAYWQKVKMDDETVDVRIAGFEEATGEKSGTLGAVVLETADGSHIGKSGSGFSDAQRESIWNNQDEWMGRTIEVEARGIGSQGNLRMPIFVKSRHDDGEPDSRERIEEIMKHI